MDGQVFTLTEVQKAYLAGIWDGEGSIIIARATNSYNKKSRRIYHQLRVFMGNTDRKLVQWVKDTIGCGYIQTRKPKSIKHKTTYIYFVHSLNAKLLLEAIYPYLITKKPQATIALEFAKTINPKNNNICGRNGLPQHIVDTRELCKISINALNGNNGGAKSKHWKNNGGEVGETLPGNADGNPEPSNRLKTYGRA